MKKSLLLSALLSSLYASVFASTDPADLYFDNNTNTTLYAKVSYSCDQKIKTSKVEAGKTWSTSFDIDDGECQVVQSVYIDPYYEYPVAIETSKWKVPHSTKNFTNNMVLIQDTETLCDTAQYGFNCSTKPTNYYNHLHLILGDNYNKPNLAKLNIINSTGKPMYTSIVHKDCAPYSNEFMPQYIEPNMSVLDMFYTTLPQCNVTIDVKEEKSQPSIATFAFSWHNNIPHSVSTDKCALGYSCNAAFNGPNNMITYTVKK